MLDRVLVVGVGNSYGDSMTELLLRERLGRRMAISGHERSVAAAARAFSPPRVRTVQ
jgi:hypothetical protein